MMTTFGGLERIEFKREMSEQEWMDACAKAYPDWPASYRATGKRGWVNLLSIEGMPALRPSTDGERWWVDACPLAGPLHDRHGMNGRLIGSYHFANGKGVGEIFYKVKGVEL